MFNLGGPFFEKGIGEVVCVGLIVYTWCDVITVTAHLFAGKHPDEGDK